VGGVAIIVLAFYPPHPPKYFVLGKTPFRNNNNNNNNNNNDDLMTWG
jgi:hypothetical protein